MLKQVTIARLAQLAKVDEAALTTAIKDAEEKDVAIDAELQVLTKAESDTRDRNKYNEGKTAGGEMVLKEIKTKHGIEVDGLDADKVVDAIGKKAVDAAKIAPNEQVEEQKKLVGQWKTKATQAEEKAASLEKEKGQLSTDNKLVRLFPKNRLDIMTDEEFLGSVKNKYDLQLKDGREVVVDRSTGEIIRDKTKLEPVAPADVLTGYFTERKWMGEEGGGEGGKGGRGGKDSIPGGKGSKFGKLSEVNQHVVDQGYNIMGGKGLEMVKAAIKENPDMDLNS